MTDLLFIKEIYLYTSFFFPFSEVPIASGRASVLLYDDAAQKWVASGTSQGLSQLQLYRDITNNTLRVVGRMLMNDEVSNRYKSRCRLLVICRNRMFYNNGGIQKDK